MMALGGVYQTTTELLGLCVASPSEDAYRPQGGRENGAGAQRGPAAEGSHVHDESPEVQNQVLFKYHLAPFDGSR